MILHKILIVYPGHPHLGHEEDEVCMVLDLCHVRYGGVRFEKCSAISMPGG